MKLRQGSLRKRVFSVKSSAFFLTSSHTGQEKVRRRSYVTTQDSKKPVIVKTTHYPFLSSSHCWHQKIGDRIEQGSYCRFTTDLQQTRTSTINNDIWVSRRIRYLTDKGKFLVIWTQTGLKDGMEKCQKLIMWTDFNYLKSITVFGISCPAISWTIFDSL